MMPSFRDFFMFSNPESQCLFEWLADDNPGFSPEKAVADAYAAIERDPDLKAELDTFDCVSSVLRKALARQLDQMLEELADADEVKQEYHRPGEEARLFAGLLQIALSGISTFQVAEAILRMLKKWSPNTTIPEIE